jgi:hypothetical protein
VEGGVGATATEEVCVVGDTAGVAAGVVAEEVDAAAGDAADVAADKGSPRQRV